MSKRINAETGLRPETKKEQIMNIKPIGSNQTELVNGNTKILFSYQTPVAAINLTPEFHAEHGSSCIKTSKKWSRTTSKHINAWLAGAKAAEVDQLVLDTLTN